MFSSLKTSQLVSKMYSDWLSVGHMFTPEPIPWLERWDALIGSPGGRKAHPFINCTSKAPGRGMSCWQFPRRREAVRQKSSSQLQFSPTT